MLQINFIRENTELVKQKLAKKHVKNIDDIDNLIRLDEEKRSVQQVAESNQAEANQLAKKIGELMKSGQKEEAEKLKVRTAEIKESSKTIEENLKKLEEDIFVFLV